MSDPGKPVPDGPPAAGAPAGDGANRRQSERKSLRSKALLQFSGRSGLEVRTLDVSASGMAIVAPSNLPSAAVCIVQLVLPLKKGRFPLQVNARVVHSIFSGTESGFKVGLQFLGPSPNMAAALAQYIEGG